MRKLKNFLDQRLVDGDAPFSSDFDIIDHRNCDYDSTSGLNLDIDSVLGGDVGSVSPLCNVRDALHGIIVLSTCVRPSMNACLLVTEMLLHCDGIH